jgi:hypothetical protein
VINQSVFLPQLRVFRRLDQRLLSPEAVEYFDQEEGSSQFVDSDRARNFEWTQEVMSATDGAALVDGDGNILYEFSGDDAVAKAEKARSSARMTFDLGIDNADEADDDVADGHEDDDDDA